MIRYFYITVRNCEPCESEQFLSYQARNNAAKEEWKTMDPMKGDLLFWMDVSLDLPTQGDDEHLTVNTGAYMEGDLD